ncbi:MAG TPA: GNAT family N-acetyltransferase [Anaerolineales bacterium]|nr:GNAT family N-acetyltransferase [Anaerolineales bacterium]HNA87805.1 GNAT family N-acetyltransferase [Anaerolineales bacterium]HNB34901.1 GNAT family N-acetyltransferase [Anaerolineales bacterium]
MNQMPPNLREFNFDGDYERILKLWQGIETGINVGRSDTSEEIKKKIERDPDLFLVAEQGNEIIGTVIGAFDGRRGMIYHLAVRKDQRKHGIGTMLLTEVEKRLQAKGCIKCYLLVLADNNQAIHFYEDLGWQESKQDRIFSKEF